MQSRCDRKGDEGRARLAAGLAAYATGVSADDIMNATRGPAPAGLARHVAMYLTYAGLGMSYGRVAAAFGRDRTTVSYAVQRMEDFREDPDVDHWLQALEAMLRSAPEPDALNPLLKGLG
jgi:hypothetical protein